MLTFGITGAWQFCPWSDGVADTGRLIPSPSKSFLDASSRGERGISWEAVERGVVGEDLEAMDLTDDPEEWVSSVSSSVVSIVTVGNGWETAGLKRRGCGLNLTPSWVFGDVSTAGGGDERCPRLEAETARLGVRTELLFPPRLQEDAASDFEGVATVAV